MNKVLKAVLVVLMLAVVGLYAYEVFAKGVDPMENLLRTVIILVSAVISISKIGRAPSRGLSFYEEQYKDKILDAFAEDPKNKKRLLEVLKLYNEDRMKQAANQLISLKESCQTPADYRAVGLFLALVLTDMELVNEAVNEYELLLAKNLGTTTIYSNLGSIYSRGGQVQKAKECFEKALFLDPSNPYAYNNLAKLHFDLTEMKEAEKYALKALDMNSKVYQASSLLAIIYAMEDEFEKSEKYFHMAVAAGQNPKELKQAMEYYTEN